MICDLAEVYHITNYRELSPSLVATLVLGLSTNSRTKMKLTGQRLTAEQMLLAMMADSLQFLAWSKTKEAKRGRYSKKSILKTLLGEDDDKKDELQPFRTPEELEAYLNGFIGD